MSDTVVVTRPWPTGAAAQARLPRLLAAGQAGRTDLAHHLAAHGPVPYRGTPHQLIEEIRAAGLTGRGGAAFPTAVKMTAVAGGRASPVVVGNGAEGEPASDKDKHLLFSALHLVLDGLQLAAEAIGAGRAYLYVHRHDRLHRLLGRALAERSAARRDRVAVELVPAPPRFLAGEESALVSRVNRGLALPTFKQPRVFERGVGGAPTLVQNVETLAHVALIARHGAAWFRLPVARPCRPCSRAGITAPGFQPRRPPGCRFPMRRCARPALPWAPASSPRCRQTDAASRKPRGWCAISRRSRQGSAGRVSPGCPG